MRKLIMVSGGVLMIMAAAVAYARPTKRMDPVTQTCRIFTPATIAEGAQLFRSTCKSCHSRGNAAGAPFLHSEAKISRAWNRVFATRYPGCAKDGSWAALNDEQLRRLNDFLYMNSADSYDPYNGRDCG